MESFVRRFIKASLVWLGVGVVIGVWMTISPAAAVHRPAHMHANLLGFVSMMIFGVAYHVVPRFTGNALRSRRVAAAHVVVANAGLTLMVAGWLGRMAAPDAARAALVAGGVASTAGAFMFIANIWMTLDAPAARPMLRKTG